jgi:hypothetical protein
MSGSAEASLSRQRSMIVCLAMTPDCTRVGNHVERASASTPRSAFAWRDDGGYVPDGRGPLDLRAELARIDRERAQTQKLVQRAKLIAESGRDRWLLLFLLASISGGLIVAIATHACR